jgi:tetratricopeptide (TPR) repeat protein
VIECRARGVHGSVNAFYIALGDVCDYDSPRMKLYYLILDNGTD